MYDIQNLPIDVLVGHTNMEVDSMHAAIDYEGESVRGEVSKIRGEERRGSMEIRGQEH